MDRLSVANRVLFVDSIGGRRLGHRDFRAIARRLRSFLRGMREVRPGLVVLSPVAVPAYRSPIAKWINKALLRAQVNCAARRLGFREPLVWLFNPRMLDAAEGLESCALIYHCVDRYEDNAHTDRDSAMAAEAKVLDRADLVFTTSVPLYEERVGRTRRLVLAENVADVERFSNYRGDVPRDLLDIPGPRIAYVGNISGYKVDLELLAEIARARPDWSLILIGPEGIGDPYTDTSSLRGQSNVHFLGAKAYESLPAYISGMDVCLVPFTNGRVSDASMPMKFFEYLAAGKPVVALPIEALRPHSEAFIAADGVEGFIDGITRAMMSDSTQAREARRCYSKDHSWSNRFREIEARVLEMLDDAHASVQGSYE